MIMAITPVGNQVYIHQATPLISQMNQAIFQRFDMQAYLAGEIEKNKEFAEMYNKSGYIALIDKNSVIENTVKSNKTGCIELL